jgi:hypothetical protein
MKLEGRARRRHDRWRMVEKAKRVIRVWMGRDSLTAERNGATFPPDHAQRLADNLKACSCYMCADDRDQIGPPMQERRAIARAESDPAN